MATATHIGDLPPEGDEEEAREVVARNPIKLPVYRLERVAISQLQVDYAKPYGDGYARPLSDHRLKTLRRDWNPLAVSPMTISRRSDGSMMIIDGNHRRVVAYEKGITQLPAMVHTGLTRETEAELYTLLGTVLGQTPWTRFQAKLVAGDDAARACVRIAERYGLEVNAQGHIDGRIQAVSRVEWVLARGGEEALNWVLAFLSSAFGGDRDSIGEMQLEGVFGFYLRYQDQVQREVVARMLGAGGIHAWHDRAAAVYQRLDVGNRGNTYGVAIAEVVNEMWKKQGKKQKDLLPAWVANLSVYNLSNYRDVKFGTHVNAIQKPNSEPAPQQLAMV